MNAVKIKQRWPEAFAAYQTWWRALTKKTDPSRIPDLSWEAFKAGFEMKPTHEMGAERSGATPSLSPSEPSGRGESGGIQGPASEASMNKEVT